ncbi:OmpA family protein [Aliamphritea hakodatensis]|uniref:OmpA family protein n=1 Tax=Aliamphritea hakodatensis TaxID=2895352 RepID=UPI0022FD3A00|nr:OmpA family protein [Aliamphritea hakodatensis]
MKKLALCAGLITAMGLSGVAQAHNDHTGYAVNSSDTNWKTSAGECWQISEFKSEDLTVDCGAEPAKEPAPVMAKEEPKTKTMMVSESKSFVVNFAFDSSEVESVSNIANYANSLKKLDAIRLNGYTDDIGSNSYNNALSERRVKAVEAALTNAGVSTSSIVSHHYGEADPVRTCAESGKSQISCLRANRRVEVMIEGQNQVTVSQ